MSDITNQPANSPLDDDASVGMAMPDDDAESTGSESSSGSDDGISTMTGDSVGGEGQDAGPGIDIDMTDSDGPDLQAGDDLDTGAASQGE
jgi:hypothetical protein